MKPGSSERCRNRTITVTRAGVLRCRLRRGHEGMHQAPQGRSYVWWNAPSLSDVVVYGDQS